MSAKKIMKSIEIAGRQYTIKGELPNGAFYLEGPRDGSVLFAKPIADSRYAFHPVKNGGYLKDLRGFPVTATSEEFAE